jgi:hypothetical protein
MLPNKKSLNKKPPSEKLALEAPVSAAQWSSHLNFPAPLPGLQPFH